MLLFLVMEVLIIRILLTMIKHRILKGMLNLLEIQLFIHSQVERLVLAHMVFSMVF